MAAIALHLYLLILLCIVSASKNVVDRRFSDFKRCTDDECSMLMCRGKAARDFSGPDCRFLTFKKGETIYVYYKLSGRRTDMWAGSVGSRFGYFPKDLLEINHIYTEKELEVPAEETDFVCFDGGFDKFDNYDIDKLLGASGLVGESDASGQETSVKEKEAQSSTAESKEGELEETLTVLSPDESNDVKEATGSEPQPLPDESSDEVLDKEIGKEIVNEDKELTDLGTTETPELTSEKLTEIPDTKSQGDDAPIEATTEKIKHGLKEDQHIGTSADSIAPEEDHAKDHTIQENELLSKEDVPSIEDTDHVAEEKNASNLKTNLGSTFDAVISDDENTRRVTTVYDDFEDEDVVEMQQDHVDGDLEVTPLLSYSEERPLPPNEMQSDEDDTSESAIKADRPESEEYAPEEFKEESEGDTDDKGTEEDKSMWTSLGDTVFAIVSGGERTNQVTSLEEDDEDEEDNFDNERIEEMKESNEDTVYLLGSDIKEDHEERVHVPEESVDEQDIPNDDTDHKPDSVTDGSLSVETAKEVTPSTDEGKLNTDMVDEEKADSDQEKILDPEKLSENSDQTLEVTDKQVGESANISENSRKDPAKEHQEDLKIQSMEGNQHFENVVSSEHNSEQNQTVKGKENGTLEDVSEKAMIPEQELNKESPETIKGNDLDQVTEISNQSKYVDAGHKLLAEEESDPELEVDLDEEVVKQTENINEDLPDPDLEEPSSTEVEDSEYTGDEEEEEEELLEDENALTSKSENLHVEADEKDPDILTEVEADLVEEATKETASKVKDLEEHQAVNDSYVETKQAKTNKDIEVGIGNNTDSADNVNATDPDVGVTVSEEIQLEDLESTNVDDKPDSLAGLPTENEDKEHVKETKPSKELEYGDSITQLTLLRGHFDEKHMERFQKYLGSRQVLQVEALFQDLELELEAARQTTDITEDIEKALDSILESSESSILDEIERMLDTREMKNGELQQMDGSMFDEEAAILDDFQELAFQLRQKYSTVSDSAPLVSEKPPPEETPSEPHSDMAGSEVEADIETLADNHTLSNEGSEPDAQEPSPGPHESSEKPLPQESALPNSHSGADVGFEEDGGHFNRNKDSHFIEDIEDIQKSPQATLESPMDVGLGFNMEHSLSGSLDSPAAPEYPEDEKNNEMESDHSFHGITEMLGYFTLAKEYLGAYTEILIATLPEEWQPGPDFYGWPWEPVVVTALVGVLSFLIIFWRTLLAVKSRTYLMTEKQLVEKIKQLMDEKSEALSKISDLNKQIEERAEQLKHSEKSSSSAKRENKELQEMYKELQKTNEQTKERVRALNKSVDEEKKKNRQQERTISETKKSIDQFQSIIEANRAELSKLQTLVDEARLKEEALKAEVQSFQKENTTLKDQKKNLLKDAKGWEEKHRELCEQIKVLQKSQKELEDTVVHKENEIEVLSDCIAELQQLEAEAKYETAELQKGDSQNLPNGEILDKNDMMRNRIKQMMDVSRVRTTLTIVQEERDRYLTKLLSEEKDRHELEEQIKKLEHDQASLAGEKCHLENQFKTIQQKLEIMNEMYQQKENALQQKLTQEEFERREKEQKLSEVGGKAVQAEEELKAYKQRIQEVEEELQKTERSYKIQIASHEKKAHENWLNARASERALVEEKRITANLRLKLIEVNDKVTELQRPSLIKPTPGRPDRQMPSVRRGDSYGPSPVSGGAPSPPLMIEGPGRPPSAPLGRRDAFDSHLGPRRPPSETLGRFSELGHPLSSRPDAGVGVPRTSSPGGLDGSQSSQAEPQSQSPPLSPPEVSEAVNSRSQGPPSFPGTPISSPPSGPTPPPSKPFGPPPMAGPFPLSPNGPTPPPMMGPLNGHPPMHPNAAPLGPGPRYGPPHPRDKGPYGPRPYGAGPPPNIRGPPPLRDYPPGPPPPFGQRDLPPGMRDHPPAPHGPRDYQFPPKNLPPGAFPPPGSRDYPGPPPSHHMGPRDFPTGPPVHPSMAHRDYPPGPGSLPLQDVPREETGLQNGP
ncbi:transport and Golgi organization protein 1 homolog isoform X2 [Amia ocellicauda]|uniref:transport and Golgi organization protein 1 homolog isoform X2 n=1 Tax=Amia ocellicauda TaxID=2972642 RepID=UPI0034644CDD